MKDTLKKLREDFENHRSCLMHGHVDRLNGFPPTPNPFTETIAPVRIKCVRCGRAKITFVSRKLIRRYFDSQTALIKEVAKHKPEQ